MKDKLSEVSEMHNKEQHLKRLREKYNELIFAVVKKYPNETRHETALRYIKQAESDTTENAKQPK
jgi:hypothetical protein